MLTNLTIKNFGLIDSLSIEFDEKLNTFTGETGAGKSILIDALRYALGEKIDPSQVRDADKSCTVEAVFQVTDKILKDSPFLYDYIDQDEDNILIIQRTFSNEGRSKNKINGLTVTVTQLKKTGNNLVDLHGPHDHQMLFSEKEHIKIIDRLSKIKDLKNEYFLKYDAYATIQKEINDLKAMTSDRERDLDTFSHQIKEIEQVSLEEHDYENTLQENARINNTEKLYEHINKLLELMDNDQTGINQMVSEAFTSVSSLNNIDESTMEFSTILSRIQDNCTELSSYLNEYSGTLSFKPGEADKINKAYDMYYDILRKYGPELNDVKAFYEEIKTKYDLLMNLEHNDSELKVKLVSAKENLKKTANKLTAKRKQTAEDLKDTIEKELGELGITRVEFECKLEKVELNKDGQDKVTFYISPNVGEGLKPLANIVSSGEAARVMLALKKALTKVDQIPVLIFDEIDAQIGGRLGTITGKKLKELSSDRQVILITHLPQIASFGDLHFKVLKTVQNKRTLTTVEPLDKTSRIEELAKMMSGEKRK